MNNRLTQSLLIASLLLVLTETTFAQFPGDVFFSEPSIALESGEVAELELQLFTGDEIFGAMQLEIIVDPDKLELIDVSPNPDLENSTKRLTATSDEKIRLLILNVESIEKPFGTITLGKVRVRATGDVGDMPMVEISPVEFVNGKSEILSTDGMSAVVTITPPANGRRAAPTVSEPGPDEMEDLLKLAAQVRRKGHEVVLTVGEWFNGVFQARRVRVDTTDPDAPSD